MIGRPYLKSAAFALSAATAILGRRPVLQLFSDGRRENPRKFRREQERKAVLLRLMLVARHFVGCRNYPEGPTHMLTAELPAVQIPFDSHRRIGRFAPLNARRTSSGSASCGTFPGRPFGRTAADTTRPSGSSMFAKRTRDVGVTPCRPPIPETQSEATMRLLFERATLCVDAPALHELPASATPQIHVNPNDLRPGTPPPRWAGMKPKCFFALLKAFVGVMTQGQPPEPEIVFAALRGNPSYARACGFTLPEPNGQYRHSDVPSLRKLEQFDQIMTTAGLWSEAAVDQVARNLKTGRIQAESAAVHDTTHYQACSGMQVVELPPAVEPSQNANATHPPRRKQGPARRGERPRARKKSHPKTTNAAAARTANTARTRGSTPTRGPERWSNPRARCTGRTKHRRWAFPANRCCWMRWP